MTNEGTQFSSVLERIGRDVLAQLDGISQEDLNRQIPLPEANTLFALATHLVGAGEFWVLVLVGERNIPRDRAEEFRATGTYAELVERYERWLAAVHEVLNNMPDTQLKQLVEPPAHYRAATGDEGPLTVSACLLHAVEHSALHLGHIQITCQMLELVR